MVAMQMGEQNSIDVTHWNAIFHQLQTCTVAGIYQPYFIADSERRRLRLVCPY
ncbi:Uncharacterised protein [Salmonella enterica subsp. arizonae]|uniref:Uncharacterized protein n=1 Tax=Salmonella enterica subsp. arizonae TaxID=59203 RepID=A0A379S582_SALER|nr:Uncharacterised protein [Salmonella enterica subsp. arizonae]